MNRWDARCIWRPLSTSQVFNWPSWRFTVTGNNESKLCFLFQLSWLCCQIASCGSLRNDAFNKRPILKYVNSLLVLPAYIWRCNFRALSVRKWNRLRLILLRLKHDNVHCYSRFFQYRVVLKFVWLVLVMENLNTLTSTKCCLCCIQKVWRQLEKQWNPPIQCNCRPFCQPPKRIWINTKKFRKRIATLLSSKQQSLATFQSCCEDLALVTEAEIRGPNSLLENFRLV